MIKAKTTNNFAGIYKGKNVLVTGHTGFKGSWLSVWLMEQGANVIGYSLDVPTQPSNFEELGLEKKLVHITGDVRDLPRLKRVFSDFSPDVVFHLAAQAITRRSYDMPQETFFTNVMGTVNILECMRTSRSVRAGVIITSDKCYQNVEWIWGYRENDRLGGHDPYSASKACAETACHSYMKSFFSAGKSPAVSTARAGNVIGGGDWAADRIVPDCARAFSSGKRLEIRSPEATRPWQHVLEPLSGYLWLGARLLRNDKNLSCESFNFGPADSSSKSVKELITLFSGIWKGGKWVVSKEAVQGKKEATLLKLNCDKASLYLNWHAVLSFEETVKMTADWYMAFYGKKKDMYSFTVKQVRDYTALAGKRGEAWAV